jgi:hypothetical protein
MKDERIRAMHTILDLSRKMYLTERNGGFNGIPKKVRDLWMSATRHAPTKSMFDFYFPHRKDATDGTEAE